NSGRISISPSPSCGLGQRLTQSNASWNDDTFHSQKPAMSSLVSAKGPSMTVRLLPEKRTRAPLLLGCRPSPASMMPALTSSSLNLPIAASNSWLGILPASESLLAFTMIMNRMLVSITLDCSWLGRTGRHEIDRRFRFILGAKSANGAKITRPHVHRAAQRCRHRPRLVGPHHRAAREDEPEAAGRPRGGSRSRGG